MEDEQEKIEITDENPGGESEQIHEDTVDNGGRNDDGDNGGNSDNDTNKDEEKKFTQADIDNAVNKALARKLPPKKEMEKFRNWKKSQQTEQEKAQERERHYLDVEKENESLKHENLVIKAGVRDPEDINYVLYRVEKMEGDFEDNLENFLKTNEKYKAPETKRVEGADHKPKSKETITRKELNAMSYKERAEYKKNNPEAYMSAMKGK